MLAWELPLVVCYNWCFQGHSAPSNKSFPRQKKVEMEEELTQGIPAARPRHKSLSSRQTRAARQSPGFPLPHTAVLISWNWEYPNSYQWKTDLWSHKKACPCLWKRAKLCLRDWNYHSDLEISKGLLCSSATQPALIFRASNPFRLFNSLNEFWLSLWPVIPSSSRISPGAVQKTTLEEILEGRIM